MNIVNKVLDMILKHSDFWPLIPVIKFLTVFAIVTFGILSICIIDRHLHKRKVYLRILAEVKKQLGNTYNQRQTPKTESVYGNNWNRFNNMSNSREDYSVPDQQTLDQPLESEGVTPTNKFLYVYPTCFCILLTFFLLY